MFLEKFRVVVAFSFTSYPLFYLKHSAIRIIMLMEEQAFLSVQTFHPLNKDGIEVVQGHEIMYTGFLT